MTSYDLDAIKSAWAKRSHCNELYSYSKWNSQELFRNGPRVGLGLANRPSETYSPFYLVRGLAIK